MKRILAIIFMMYVVMGHEIVFEQAEQPAISNIDYVKDTLRSGILGYIDQNEEEKYVMVNLNS